jgi:2-polyprenyl-3-methyl-5-hydroxy-6-metoxy-1,4-benzoquinol methylase
LNSTREKAVTVSKNMANELAEAAGHFNQGRFDDAITICHELLAKDPDNVSALNILGGCLARTGKIPQAIQVAERVCRLVPGNAVYYSNLSYLHSVAGNFPKAILVMAHAIMSDARNPAYQAKFSRMVDQLEFYIATAETAAIREAIRICLVNPGIDAGSFSTAWHSLLLLDPVFVQLTTLTQDGAFKEQAEEVNTKELAAPLADPFLLLGLKSLHATDVRLERIMTFLRRFLLSSLDDYDSASFLPFLCALAEHCNLNEYVYSFTPEEQTVVEALYGKWDLSAKVDVSTMARIALVSCYRDLAHTEDAELIAEAAAGSQNHAFKILVENTISIPRKTREYYESIAAISSSNDFAKNAVSSSVAKQYEENPYPRWRHLDIPVLTEKQKALGKGRNILVAGCGTGFEPLNMAMRYPEAKVSGIDLSVPSLAYGKHKAVEFGIDNIEFMKADILELEDLGQQYDLISCAGVLHHMEDPAEGWRKLLTCLKQDGLMKIALYSEAARQSVISCRSWIEKEGFASTPEGIRDFRQAIMDMDTTNPLRDIVNWTDFFSMSMCRDLVFHVQEHNVTLPWIKSVLDDLGLCCLSMRISNPLFRKEYLSKYPDDPGLANLDNLHEYEKHNPRTFRDMYQFWCCRKDSLTVGRPPEWFYTADLLS